MALVVVVVFLATTETDPDFRCSLIYAKDKTLLIGMNYNRMNIWLVCLVAKSCDNT